MLKFIRYILTMAIAGAAALWLVPLAWMSSRQSGERVRLVWGPKPIINNKYWSQAMQRGGYESTTLMQGYYQRINSKADFDLYYDDFCPFRNRKLKALWLEFFSAYTVFGHVLASFDIVHHPMSGGFLADTPLERVEAQLLRLAGIRVVILPYGADAYPYSQVADLSLRHALLLSYPKAARTERRIRQRMDYWTHYADAIVPGCMTDGVGRWDVLVPSSLAIDVEEWVPSRRESSHDGKSGPVNVMHTPNHRGFKGTEFLVAAVDQLRREGLQIDLYLLEGVQNSEIRRVMREDVDILAEQFIFPGGYAMSGIEGMAVGLPVLANLGRESYTQVFRRYSFLNECPVLSTPPELLVENLRQLVTDPSLRHRLGREGRTYVERYHSYRAAHRLFSSIYRSFSGDDVDLLQMFHPVSTSTGLAASEINRANS